MPYLNGVSAARPPWLGAVENGRAHVRGNRTRPVVGVFPGGCAGEFSATHSRAGQNMPIVETCCNVCVFAVVHLESPGDWHLELSYGTPHLARTRCMCNNHFILVFWGYLGYPLRSLQFSMFLSVVSTLRILFMTVTSAWRIHLRPSAAVAPAPKEV